MLFFFTSYTVKLKTQKVLDHLSKAGRFEYIYIFNIAYGAFKSNFYKLDKIDLDIKFEDVVILENERDKAIKEGSLGLKDRLTRVNAILKFKDKEIKSRIRLKGDRKMHFVKKSILLTIFICQKTNSFMVLIAFQFINQEQEIIFMSGSLLK